MRGEHIALWTGDLDRMKAFYERYAHLAISLGCKQAVVDLTEAMRRDGSPVWSEPRTTGDGYFESVVLDPDGNRIELTV
jgi:lactoylglutathione lyase